MNATMLKLVAKAQQNTTRRVTAMRVSRRGGVRAVTTGQRSTDAAAQLVQIGAARLVAIDHHTDCQSDFSDHVTEITIELI